MVVPPEVAVFLGLTTLAALLLAALLAFNWWHRRRDERLARLSLDDLTHAETRLELIACLEALTGIRRAGADLVVTYHAKDAARWLQGS